LQPRDTSYHYLGNAYGYLGRYDEALDAYQHSLKINPNYVKVYPDLGAAYYRLHRYQDSAEAFEQAIKFRQDDAKAFFGLGMAQLALGNKDKALVQYRALQSLEPEWATWLLGEINKGSSLPVFRNALRPGVRRQARVPGPAARLGFS
jgi:tetratricopeptide (TPR) repeat protein